MYVCMYVCMHACMHACMYIRSHSTTKLYFVSSIYFTPLPLKAAINNTFLTSKHRYRHVGLNLAAFIPLACLRITIDQCFFQMSQTKIHC